MSAGSGLGIFCVGHCGQAPPQAEPAALRKSPNIKHYITYRHIIQRHIAKFCIGSLQQGPPPAEPAALWRNGDPIITRWPTAFCTAEIITKPPAMPVVRRSMAYGAAALARRADVTTRPSIVASVRDRHPHPRGGACVCRIAKSGVGPLQQGPPPAKPAALWRNGDPIITRWPTAFCTAEIITKPPAMPVVRWPMAFVTAVVARCAIF